MNTKLAKANPAATQQAHTAGLAKIAATTNSTTATKKKIPWTVGSIALNASIMVATLPPS